MRLCGRIHARNGHEFNAVAEARLLGRVRTVVRMRKRRLDCIHEFTN